MVKQKNKSTFQILCFVAVTFVLVACGGGGGNDETTTGGNQNTTPAKPTVSFSVSPQNINTGQSSKFTWSSSHATSCVASGAWSGDKALTGSEDSSVFETAGTFDFELSCSGEGGTTQTNAQIIVAEIIEPEPQPQPYPNILLIIADDMGKDATNGFSEGLVKPTTPNLDDIQNQSLSFNNFWASPTCAPTRTSMITGKYGYSTDVKWVQDTLDPQEVTLQSHINTLTNNRYSTALVGKWHLSGDNPTANPEDFGIDYYAGINSGEVDDYYNWQLSEDGVPTTQTEYATTKLTDIAIDWLTEQEDDKPWFMWMAYNAPHTPFHVPPSTMHSQGDLADYEEGVDALPYYLAAIEAMDHQIGRLLENIPQDQLENTVIIVMADNGTPATVSQSPYGRFSSKGSVMQGGVNVPLFVTGKGITRSGLIENLATATDIFSTISELAGIENPNIHDSLSLKPLFTQDQHIRDYQYTEKENGTLDLWAISDGEYKLIVNADGSKRLFHLVADPHEETDLIATGSLSSAEQTIMTELETELSLIRIHDDGDTGGGDGGTGGDDGGTGGDDGDNGGDNGVLTDKFYTGMALLNDTGIGFGSDATSNGGACSTTITGTDGSRLEQDCSQGRSTTANSDTDGESGFDFTRINADGSEYSGSGNFSTEPWACVRDDRTGLLWEVKTNDSSIHDAKNFYRWGGLTAQDRDNVDREGDYYDDWNNLIISTNQANFCGYSDWRVPNNSQFMSLVNFGDGFGPASSKIDQDYFPNATNDFYWTASPYRGAHSEFYAWAFQLAFGNNKNIQRYQPSALRLVRVMDPYTDNVEQTPDDRYEIHNNGTVTDLETGLMWAQCVAGLSGIECGNGTAEAMDWGLALEHAQTSELAGYSDWRLPNIKELYSLVDFNRVEPAINLNVFPATTVDYTWSSSPMIDFRQDAWFVNFKAGLNWFKGRSSNMLVRMVRSGPDDLALAEVDAQDGMAIVEDDGFGTPAGVMEPVDVHAQVLIDEQGFTGDPTTGRDLPNISDEKAQLGKALFYSKRLSGEYDAACASCHHPILGGGDNLSWPVGYDAVDVFHNFSPDVLGEGRYFNGSEDDELPGYPVIGRNAPTLFNVGLLDRGLFWDSRVESVSATEGARGTDAGIITPDSPDFITADNNIPEGSSLANAQSRFPTANHNEMRGDEPLTDNNNQAYRDMLAARFSDNADWEAMFQAAFGDTEVSFDRIAEALATFEESMVFTDNPWQEYVAALRGDPGTDIDVMTQDEKIGAVLFMTAGDEGGAACSECHSGDTFTDEEFHAIGLGQVGPGNGDSASFPPVNNSDFGRANISGDVGDTYHFRTSPLLNITETGPYMHNGALSTLRQVMDVYGNPGGAMNDLLGISTILNGNAVFNELNNADYCELTSVKDIMDKTGETCEQVYNNINPDAFLNTRILFRQTFDETVSNSPAPEIDINTDQSSTVIEFMGALTDPCVTDRECLQPWIIDSSNWTEHPDYSDDPNLILVGKDKDGNEL
ncbi:Lcl domain-containing protein [Paraglaciecola sp.]|uniref:Lcl domain-containing protein n=1 Tax=Paraglaciecola sp. TaxID=1920173 RepID=UPI003EF50B99